MTGSGSERFRDGAKDHGGRADDELLLAARNGDVDAYGELWRRHSEVGKAVARNIAPASETDDIVAEAFTRILSTIERGHGPTFGFRPYLITTVRNVSITWVTKPRAVPVDDLDWVQEPESLSDTSLRALDRTLTMTAFRSLPTSWRQVLWYSEVEGMDPHEIGPLLGLSANAVSSLARRARTGLRAAWIQAHVTDDTAPPDCRWTIARFGGWVINTLSARDRVLVDAHLDECLRCQIIASELKDIGAGLTLVALPLISGATVGGGVLATLRAASAATAQSLPPRLPEFSVAQRTTPPTRSRSLGWGLAAMVVAAGVAASIAAATVLGQASSPIAIAPSPHPNLSPSKPPATAPPTPTPSLTASSTPVAETSSQEPSAPLAVALPADVEPSPSPSPSPSSAGASLSLATGQPEATVSVTDNGSAMAIGDLGRWAIADGSHAMVVSATSSGATVELVQLSLQTGPTASNNGGLGGRVQSMSLSGTSEPGSIITVTDATAATVLSVTADAAGVWSTGELVGLVAGQALEILSSPPSAGAEQLAAPMLLLRLAFV